MGADVYIFNEGDGNDTIMGSDLSQDTLQINTNASNIKFTRSGLDLLIGLSNTQDEIKVIDYFNPTGSMALGTISTLDNRSYNYLLQEG